MATGPECHTSETRNPVEYMEASIKRQEETLTKMRLALEFLKANPGYVAMQELGGRY